MCFVVFAICFFMVGEYLRMLSFIIKNHSYYIVYCWKMLRVLWSCVLGCVVSPWVVVVVCGVWQFEWGLGYFYNIMIFQNIFCICFVVCPVFFLCWCCVCNVLVMKSVNYLLRVLVISLIFVLMCRLLIKNLGFL